MLSREYILNVVALYEMQHQTAELFDPTGRVFGCRGMSIRATVAGYSERRAEHFKDFINHPLMQAMDLSLATFFAIPASWTTWTTSFKFL